jgi:hypothetical protein
MATNQNIMADQKQAEQGEYPRVSRTANPYPQILHDVAKELPVVERRRGGGRRACGKDDEILDPGTRSRRVDRRPGDMSPKNCPRSGGDGGTGGGRAGSASKFWNWEPGPGES